MTSGGAETILNRMNLFSIFPEWVPVLASTVGESSHITHQMTQFVLQLAVIVIAARLGGALFRHVFNLPEVLGELTAGMIIGPYALGGMAWFGVGPVFPDPVGSIPVSASLYALATLASIILLFLAGLETDLNMFLRYFGAAGVVGLCGLLASFILGDLCAVWFGIADRFMDPSALFLGTISTATSVGITARILSEKRQTQSPEGATIMASAVLDDVLGIIILAVVVGISRIEGAEGEVDWAAIGMTAAKAFGFWLVCTTVALLSARRISRMLKISRNPATISSMALGLTLLLAGFSEMAGLAMIIGAYIMGLSLSSTDLSHFLRDQLSGIYVLLVPVFFCVMGMLVDFSAMQGTVIFGLVYSLLAVVGKVAGCAIPARCMQFNWLGGIRIGLGMLPRGEVALIVAGLGLSSGIIEPDIFGTAIMMTMITTIAAPPALIYSLRGGSGVRKHKAAPEEEEIRNYQLAFPSSDIADFLMNRIRKAFQQEEFFVSRLHTEVPTYIIRKEDMSFTLTQNGPEIVLSSPTLHAQVAGFIILEEMLSLQDLFESTRKMENIGDMENQFVRDVLNGAG